MEEQYLKLRTKLRRVQSVHRMKALYVENKVLNALDIFGLMLDQMTVESVPDAANLAAVSVSAAQYENIFEEIGPYRINGIPQAYRRLMRLGLSLAGANNPARAGARERRAESNPRGLPAGGRPAIGVSVAAGAVYIKMDVRGGSAGVGGSYCTPLRRAA